MYNTNLKDPLTDYNTKRDKSFNKQEFNTSEIITSIQKEIKNTLFIIGDW